MNATYEKECVLKEIKKQNTFKVTDTSDPHKVIVKLKVQTANSN